VKIFSSARVGYQAGDDTYYAAMQAVQTIAIIDTLTIFGDGFED
jgi:hypothetical protein